MSKYHIPVMLREVIEYLDPSDGKVFIDATLGGGNHAKALIDKGADVIGIDQDPDSISYVKSRADINQEKLVTIEANFESLTELATDYSLSEVDGILFDLGVSNHQFDKPERGFSFQTDSPLDMRMSPSLVVTAKDLVNGLGKKELYELFTKYAQEQLARPIAEAIVLARRIKPIESTRELAVIVERVYGRRKSHLHPATKVFQALRIAINDELNTLKITLPQAIKLLKAGGRLVVISFHEGEDRIVKQFINSLDESKWKAITKKPTQTSAEEQSINPRSRSAKLRVVEKINI